jgi:uncharacterized SAM-binding protein YcdF (DUF218 family)
MPWIDIREGLLLVLGEPVLFLPLLFLFCFLVLWPLSLHRSTALIVSLAFSLFGSLLYSPLATSALDHWLQRQLPPASELSVGSTPPPVAVLLGRGPEIAFVSTTAAVAAIQRGEIQAIYVSGDQRSTADRLVALGAPPSHVSGDSCARTTWENASLTAAWLFQHHPGSPVLLITDPWQLSRASLLFLRQGLLVIPQPVIPALSARSHNRIAWRESLALALYKLQGRV